MGKHQENTLNDVGHAIERRVGLGKYAPVKGLSPDQIFHGERVAARQKEREYNGTHAYPDDN